MYLTTKPAGWQVRLYEGAGKPPYRKYFSTEEKANEHAAKLNENIPMEGVAGVVFDAVARADYAAARNILPGGFSLFEAARHYIESKRQRVTVLYSPVLPNHKEVAVLYERKKSRNGL